jgi:hypothetical protein
MTREQSATALSGYSRALLLASSDESANLDEAGDLLAATMPDVRRAIEHVRASGDSDLLQRLRAASLALCAVADDIYDAAADVEAVA